MKKTKEVKKVKKVTKADKYNNDKNAEHPVCPFAKELKDMTLAHKKLFLAIANNCNSRVQTMASMYTIHKLLTDLEFEECNNIFNSDSDYHGRNVE